MVLRVEKEGFAPQITTVPVKSGVTSYRAEISLTPLQVTPMEPGVGTSTSLTVYGNEVTVEVEPLSNSGLRLLAAAFEAGDGPGTMRDAADPPSNSLQSGGIFYVQIVDGDGQPLGAVPDIRIKFNPFSLEDMEGAGPLQTYELGSNGYWTAVGPMTAPETGPEMAQRKFGYTNCDRSVRTACVKGIAKAGGGACAGAQVNARGPLGFSSADATSADGSFCVSGGYGLSSQIAIGGSSTTVSMPSTWGDCSQPDSCEDIGTLTVPSSACGETKTHSTPPPDAGSCKTPPSNPCYECAEQACPEVDFWCTRDGCDHRLCLMAIWDKCGSIVDYTEWEKCDTAETEACDTEFAAGAAVDYARHDCGKANCYSLCSEIGPTLAQDCRALWP